ncbi:Polyketide synthase, enoylreductase family protein [Heracleum sosnowskyi]|uniref:Polyketide synthase, enoylreductase family protein n=1 Tax=Heracleum sosnowskyi TaxID=360622 RepID=A0AAD8N366_9APIA|nr:Polyketide synthase, enoylreductase family protein [Heracleum sosnowskyi]
MASYCTSLLNLKPPYISSSLLLSLNLSVRSFSTAMSPGSTAIVYNQEGPPDSVTKMVELPPVEIKENDVCVKMMAAPINPSDINRYSRCIPLKGLSPGDLVIPCPPSFGTWQTYVVKEQSVWHKVDKGTPVEYAATVFVNPLTALKMLEDFVDLNQGDTIVQNGATSMVGQCIIQLARSRGIQSINITRDRAGSDEAKEKLKNLGADEVLDDPLFLSFTLLRRRIIFAASLVIKFLRRGGAMVTYGGMSKKPITVSTLSFIYISRQELLCRGCNNSLEIITSVLTKNSLFAVWNFCPFKNFHAALDKSLGKLGSQPKQVIKF